MSETDFSKFEATVEIGAIIPVLSAIAAIACSLGFFETSKLVEDLDLGTLQSDRLAFVFCDLLGDSLYLIFRASKAGDCERGDPELGELEWGDCERGDLDTGGDPELLPVS